MKFDFNMATYQPFGITNNKSIGYRLHDKNRTRNLLTKKQNNMKKSEAAIQNESYVWFTNTHGLKTSEPRMVMFSIPNEVAMMIRGVLMQTRLPQKQIDNIIAVVSQRLKNMGLKKGVSDTIVVLPEKTLYIEFKTDEGYQSQDQKEFEQTIKGLQHQYHVVRSLEQFKQIINDNI